MASETTSEQVFLSRKEAAAFLRKKGCRISWRTLDQYAWTKEGPDYYVDKARTLYTPEDLEKWRIGRLRRKIMGDT